MVKESGKKTKTKKSDICSQECLAFDQEKVLGILSYMWILCLVPKLYNKKSDFVKFHSKQGFILFLLSFFVLFPFFGQILGIFIMIVSVVAIVKVLDGEKWEIPYLGDLIKKFNI